MQIRVIDTGASNAFYNMALDEALMLECREASATDGRLFPTIRFYAFSPPAITIGRFQSPRDVQDIRHGKNGFDIVRRITGGRAVMHDGDLTYSLVAPFDDPVFGGHTSEAYKKVSLVFKDALEALSIEAELVRVRHSDYQKNPGCFSSAARYELQVNGRKILGSAQRRENGTILQQGSVLVNSKIKMENGKWQQIGLNEILSREFSIENIIDAVKTALRNTGAEVVESSVTSEEEELARELIPKYRGNLDIKDQISNRKITYLPGSPPSCWEGPPDGRPPTLPSVRRERAGEHAGITRIKNLSIMN